ncbi:MAG: hypothetical protein ACR2NZ_23280 [Rubripirellula sp.]
MFRWTESWYRNVDTHACRIAIAFPTDDRPNLPLPEPPTALGAGPSSISPDTISPDSIVSRSPSAEVMVNPRSDVGFRMEFRC